VSREREAKFLGIFLEYRNIEREPEHSRVVE